MFLSAGDSTNPCYQLVPTPSTTRSLRRSRRTPTPMKRRVDSRGKKVSFRRRTVPCERANKGVVRREEAQGDGQQHRRKEGSFEHWRSGH